jgi:toxin ParE1/3/4
MKLIWTQQAFERLQELHDYIASRISTKKANDFTDRLIKRVESLINFPQRGRVVPEFSFEALREIIEGNYRIVYLFKNDTVNIITVFERHRLFPKEDLLTS